MKTARMTIRLLREFSVGSPELGVSELSRRLSLDKATIHRLLRSLCEERIIEQDPESKKYRLGLAILDLAAARLRAFGFMEFALDEMRQLRQQVGETVGLHVRDAYDMVCIQYAEASHPLTVRFTLGERSPVHVTATGLICLAEMPDSGWPDVVEGAAKFHPSHPAPSNDAMVERIARARREHIALADQTYQRGVRGVATAVRNANGDLVAALSIVAPASRLTAAELMKHRSYLINAAARIGSKIPQGADVLGS